MTGIRPSSVPAVPQPQPPASRPQRPGPEPESGPAGLARDDASAGLARDDAPAGCLPGAHRFLLGRIGQSAALLFPAAPALRSRSRERAARLAAANIAAAGLGAGVLLIRQAGTPSWSTLWAEDATVFLPRALYHPFTSLFHQQAGYLQLVPQLIADVVARFPLRDAAAGCAIAGALVASCCAIFVYHASAGHISRPGLRALLACSVVLLPTAVIEIANSGVNAPWYLMYALFWTLVWRPASGRGRAVAAVIAFTTMASNILNLLYLPLVAARALALPRAREQAVTYGWLAGIAFQVLGIIESHGPHRLGPVTAGAHFYGQHVLVAAVAGWRLALRGQAAIGVPACIAIAAVVVAATAGWAIWRGDARVRALVATALVMSIVLSVVPALIRYWVAPAPSTALWVPGSRYTTSAVLLIDVVAIAGVDAWLRRASRGSRRVRHGAAVLVLVASLGLGWGTSLRYMNPRSSSLPWSQTYARYGRELRQAHQPPPAAARIPRPAPQAAQRTHQPPAARSDQPPRSAGQPPPRSDQPPPRGGQIRPGPSPCRGRRPGLRAPEGDCGERTPAR
jgi:hypothetical protein